MLFQAHMIKSKADIISRLQKDILSLQGFKTSTTVTADIGLGLIKHAFPNNSFPLGAIHEFISASAEDAAATNGFVSGIVASLMKKEGAAIWISATKNIFPPALKAFGIAPDRIIFIELNKEKEMLWAMEEALKCEGLAAVIADIPRLNFTDSRRLQLAVEESRVTGFILRQNVVTINTTACITRWKITTLPSALNAGLPGIGFPRWNVELLKVRNGKPGSWQVEWVAGKFRHIQKSQVIVATTQKKAV